MMREKYQAYLERFGLAYQEPMSYEEFEAQEVAAMAKKERDQKIAEGITDYDKYIDQAVRAVEQAADEWEAEEAIYEILKKARRFSSDITAALHREGKTEELGAHAEKFNAIQKQIQALRPKRQRTRTAVAATNVYEDDDTPTTIR